MDDRPQLHMLLIGNRAGIHLHLTQFAIGEPVGELKVIALLTQCTLTLLGHQIGWHGVDVLYRHVEQHWSRIAVKGNRLLIGLPDTAGLRFDEQHRRRVFLKKLPEMSLSLVQYRLSALALRNVARDTKESNDLTIGRAQGPFFCQKGAHAVDRTQRFFVGDGLSLLNDALVVGPDQRRMLRENMRIVAADGFFGRFSNDACRFCIDNQIPALQIFGKDGVG